MQTTMIIDIAFILVSLVACVYCVVLSRRLKALQDTRDGLGATILALSQSIAQLSASSRNTKTEVAQSAVTLASHVEEARLSIQKLEALKSEIERLRARELHDFVQDCREQKAGLEDSLETAKDRILELNILLRRSEAASTRLRYDEPDRALIRGMLQEVKK